MIEALGRCVICGAEITAPFWFCADCEARYSLDGPANTWPEWARDLRSLFKAERDYERDMLTNLDDSDGAASIYDRLCYGENGWGPEKRRSA